LSASAVNPSVGDDVSLDGSLATVAAGRSGIYSWTVDDPAIANFTSSTNAATATLHALAAGVVTVTFTVTDDTNQATSSRTILSVGPVTALVTSAPPAATSGGGGGGGALGLPWILGLAAAVFSLYQVRSRRV
jgi:serine protease